MVLIAATAPLSYCLAFCRRRPNCAEATLPALLARLWAHESTPAVSPGTDLAHFGATRRAGMTRRGNGVLI